MASWCQIASLRRCRHFSLLNEKQLLIELPSKIQMISINVFFLLLSIVKSFLTDVSFFSIVSYKCFRSIGTISEMFDVPGYVRRALIFSNCNRISVRKPNILFDVTGPEPGAEMYQFSIFLS